MRKKDHRALGEYTRWVANEMELRDWAFELRHDLEDESSQAEVTPIYGRKHAIIRFSPTFKDQEPEEQRQVVVHELVHLHMASVDDMMRSDLENLLGKPADTVFWNGYRRQFEYGIDGLAAAIAKHLPLIDWPE